MDVDALSWGAFMGGIACGIGPAWSISESLFTPLAAAFGVAGVLLCLPAAYTLLRKPRADDPGAHHVPPLAERR